MTTQITRRKFLLGTAVGIGAAAMACSGLAVAGLQAPIDPAYAKRATGENPAAQKVLVTYASKAGSTMEIAQAVAAELTRRNYAVDICPVKAVTDLSGYSAVVLGSAIRMAAPLPEAVKFVENNSAALAGLPTAFFAVHLMHIEDDEASRQARSAYLDPVRQKISLQHEALFAGVYNAAKVSLIERWMGKTVKTPEGDFRDWAAISSWAQSIFA